jgi:hypothetical protein
MSNHILCTFCGNLGPRTNTGICHSCMIDYERIKNYVLKNPDSILMEISNETKISVTKIMAFVRGGHFILVEGAFTSID